MEKYTALIVVLGVVCGTTYRFVFKQEIDTWAKYLATLFVVNILAAVLLMLSEDFHLRPWLSCLISLVIGLGSPDLAHLVIDSLSKISKTLPNTISRIANRKAQDLVGSPEEKKDSQL